MSNTRISTRVEIDAEDHRTVFDCTLDPSIRWNGWACPRFDYDTALRVIDMSTGGDQDNYYAFIWTTDRDGIRSLVMGESDGGDDWWWEPCGDDRTGYPIGSWGWTWREIDADAPTAPADLDAWLDLRSRRSAAYCAAHNAALDAARGAGLSTGDAYPVAVAAGTAAADTVTP